MDITHDFDPFISRMAAAEPVVRDELRAGVDRTTLQGERLAKQHIRANGSVVTGTLFRGTTATPAVWGGGQVTGRYGTAVPYAKYVENGRGPVVARGRALRFRPKGSGGYIFRKRVGPARPRPFMRPTVPVIRSVYAREMRASAQRIIAKLGGR